MRLTRQDLTLLLALIATLWYPTRRFFAGGVAAPSLLRRDLHDKLFIVTGANAGIGFETALQLARQNASVIIAVRSKSRGDVAASKIRAAVPGARVDVELLDLASFHSVRDFASRFQSHHRRLDGLIANAGVMFPPKTTTVDGHELSFQTNHLGHFLLTELLLEPLKAAAPSRIVILSSRAHDRGNLDWDDLDWEKRNYGFGIIAYADSKLANIMHAYELAKRLEGSGVTAVSVHPGVVRTELTRYVPAFEPLANTVLYPFLATFFKNSWEGAQTTLHCLLADDVPAHAGAYFADASVAPVRNPSFTDDNAATLWAISEKLVGLSA